MVNIRRDDEMILIQIEPAEQMPLLRRELDKAHTVAAILRVAVAVSHVPGVQCDGALRHGSLQIIHILK